jgi:dihydropteroate synthase
VGTARADAGLPFEWGTRTLVMGIVNCSPDSFSGDGHADSATAVAAALEMTEAGADILDVGGVSTRPTAQEVPPEVELARVLPVIERLAARLSPAIPISVDTSRACVARAAIAAGAQIVNDVWALSRDPGLAAVCAESGVTVVLMHNRPATAAQGPLGGYYAAADYTDIVAEVGTWLEERVQTAVAAGICRRRLIVDPGIGFGKTPEHNLALLRELHRLRARPGLVDLPFLLGTSRKSVIGYVLGLPVTERLEGTLATLALGIVQGVDIVRVHDVRATVRACRMADCLVRGTPPAGFVPAAGTVGPAAPGGGA